MGACVSTHHKASAMKVQASFVSDNKPDNQLVIPPSPTKEKPPIINGDVAAKPQWPPFHSTANSRDFGSKEETFFDSQAWLESDCEDDFMSVNGDFTPPRGNTPVRHNLSAGTPQVNSGVPTVDHHKPSITSSQPPLSPTKKKTRLSELFKERLRGSHDLDEENTGQASENEVVGSPGAAAVHGGEMAQNSGGLKPKRERWVVSAQGCFPSLLSSCRPVTPKRTEGSVK